jgi:tetratricopeptide (TPR) repeat protein
MSQRILIVMLLTSLAGGNARASGGGGGGGGAPPNEAKSAEISRAERLIEAKKWDEAIVVLQKAAEKDGKNADVYNWLGYAERNRGNTDAAFGYYDRALRLDPNHRGAHEYVGEAYLIVGKPEKAKEHLATLRKLCGTSCEEYEDLKKDIDEYEEAHNSAAK